MMAKLSGVDIHDFGTTFKVYRRETIKDVPLYGEMHRFIPALAAWNGARIVEVPIRNIVRPGGKSHYGISRTIRVFFDIITIRFLMRYMTRPLHFFGPPGLLGIFAGAGILTFLLLEKLVAGLSIFMQHGPLLVLGMMLCLFGVQLLAVGLVGELLTRTHFESREAVRSTVWSGCMVAHACLKMRYLPAKILSRLTGRAAKRFILFSSQLSRAATDRFSLLAGSGIFPELITGAGF